MFLRAILLVEALHDLCEALAFQMAHGQKIQEALIQSIHTVPGHALLLQHLLGEGFDLSHGTVESRIHPGHLRQECL